MGGYVPTHGPECATRTYKTRCSECGKPVFFFSCSCQSAVFFDNLGHPWPEHDCSWGERHYSDLRAQGRSARDARFQILTDASYHGRSIPDHVAESMERDFKAEKARLASGRSPQKDAVPRGGSTRGRTPGLPRQDHGHGPREQHAEALRAGVDSDVAEASGPARSRAVVRDTHPSRRATRRPQGSGHGQAMRSPGGRVRYGSSPRRRYDSGGDPQVRQGAKAALSWLTRPLPRDGGSTPARSREASCHPTGTG